MNILLVEDNLSIIKGLKYSLESNGYNVEYRTNTLDVLDYIKNNSTDLIDLKNIKINIVGDNNIKLQCDFKWQIEAISNIIKKCVEHSYNNGNIDIKYNENKLYYTIEIIDKKDLKHIFERFYKTKKSKNDSMGIGLSLSKAIIKK